jgi:hypothetical protein
MGYRKAGPVIVTMATDLSTNLPALQNLADALIAKPRVVCGMTLLPAPTGIDPKIRLDREENKPINPTVYTIRPVQPTLCW